MNNHFVGKSAFAKEMNSLVDKVSLLDVCVLLIGETGVGKKHFAKSVHKHLCGSERDFFIINCKNLTENNLENLQSNISKLENSNANKKVVTYCFNNVDLLSLDLQNTLLEIIKYARTVKIKHRFFFSSNSNLEEKVENLSFNADLYYCISAIPVNFVPLRQRKEDIGEFANYFVREFNFLQSTNFLGFSEEALHILENHFWKFNILELKNVVQQALIFAKDDIVNPSDIVFRNSVDVQIKLDDSEEDKTLKHAIDSFKKEYLTKMLEKNGWNQTKTAKILGIQRTYVIKLFNQLGIRIKKK